MKYFLSFLLISILSFFSFPDATIKVYPIGKKQSSGIIVKKGDKLTISVIGKWSLWDKYKAVGGEGHPINANEYGNWGGLLGKIDNGKIFSIGNGKDLTSDYDGILYLFPNKGKYLIENQSGNLDVTIKGGKTIDDFIKEISINSKKFTFDPQNGILPTNLYFEKGQNVEIYAIGEWTMWDGVYPATNAEGHEFEFLTEGIPWGKLYGGIGSSYGQLLEIFPTGEKTSYTIAQTGILSLYPYIGNYVSVKNGKMDIYVIGGTETTEENKKQIDDIVKNNSQSQVIYRLNQYRKSLSLPDLQLNPILSQTAFGHAKYMALNNTFSREEEESKSNFVGIAFEDRLKKMGYEGKAREMFCQMDSPVASVDLLFDTIYHRIRLLDPDLKYIGFGSYKSQDRTINVFDFGYAAETDTKIDWEKIIYPIDKSTDNKIEWNGYENPDPLPSGTVKPLGYPITIYFKDQIKDVSKVELVNNNKEIIDSFYITPDTDINNKQLNAIVIIPKKILSPSTKYTVNLTIKLGSTDIEKSYSWSFDTANK